jgi:hypothetical protein
LGLVLEKSALNEKYTFYHFHQEEADTDIEEVGYWGVPRYRQK